MINIREDTNIIYEISVEDFTYKNKDSNNVFIECNIINKLTSEIEKNVNELKKLNQKYWSETINRLYQSYYKCLQDIHLFISDLDVSSTIAKISIHNKYCKPELIENDKSCLVAENIRHPIVERLSDTTEYITNNIILGKDNKDGILLFGTNACGKSTLMKAIGLNVIMAQAGFYVSCSSLKYSPYTQIFTRILNNDNIFKRQSSFVFLLL